MLERFTDTNITIKQHKGDDLVEKNRKRHEAIREHFEQEVTVPKKSFVKHIKENITLPDKDKVIEKVNNIDFSKSNPRNNTFMNEIAFAGESLTEGFLDAFNIEVNQAVERYENQTHIIEQRLDDKSQRAFIGQFNNNKLIKKSKFFDSVQELKDKVHEKSQQVRADREPRQTKFKEQTLTLKREE